MRGRRQSGQVIVLVAFALLALIGSAALVLVAGSVEWQKNQLQQLADEAALDSAMKIIPGCTVGSATTVLTEADAFIFSLRNPRVSAFAIGGSGCATSYTGTGSFAGGLSETINYPYHGHQQQVEVILTLTLPISFGTELGQTSTAVVRRAVGQQLAGSTAAVSATTLTCAGGQVNIAGSVVAQNAIRFGNCALYAHMRFDATSSTYSDLGNVSVYTAAQRWSASGNCSAGANTGSAKAICADGFEVSGHVPTACGTVGSTDFLSNGDAAINANPCAAGLAPQPAAPVSLALLPEPNTDAAAIAKLPGGVACNPAATYPNLVVSGATVGTVEAGTAAPFKDPSGYWHFYPSCYGYLDPSSLTGGGGGGGITLVQVSPEQGPDSGAVVPKLPAPSKAGNLLVATVKSETSPSNNAFTKPAGWIQAANAFLNGTAHTTIFYYPNNPGGITSVGFGVKPNSIDAVAQLSEWAGVATASPLDKTGSNTSASQVKSFAVTSGAMTAANELVITDIGFADQGGDNAYNPGASWNPLVGDTDNTFGSEYRLNLPTGPAKETVTYGSDTTWAGVIATFKPAGGGGGGGAGAVLEPGFYYFNGSGSSGVGGICLNNGKLLARDVTLEFVNRAGFSSGTCAIGGGAGCAGASCQFGSTPCSISACPPNAGSDSPNNLSWFAAPCSSAPTGDAASCAGSTWCPVGDRACWNLLIWAPNSNTGQIAIKGAAVKHWLLGSVFWPGTCTDSVNATSMLEGTVRCGSLSISAGAGAGTAIGGDYGISTALVEAALIE